MIIIMSIVCVIAIIVRGLRFDGTSVIIVHVHEIWWVFQLIQWYDRLTGANVIVCARARITPLYNSSCNGACLLQLGINVRDVAEEWAPS
jgi:hypothetical protein